MVYNQNYTKIFKVNACPSSPVVWNLQTCGNAASEPTLINASSAKYLLNSSIISSLMGNGNVTAYNLSSKSQLREYVPIGLQNSGITEEYTVGFNSGASNSNTLQELVVRTNDSKVAYLFMLSYFKNYLNPIFLASSGAFNISGGFNETPNGLTYTYSEYSTRLIGTNIIETGTLLAGYKNASAFYLQMSNVNASEGTNLGELIRALAQESS